MARDDLLLNDDDVLQVLIEESKKNTVRHTHQGDPTYRRSHAPPKTNTRFLSNLLKNTDSHNAALRKSESIDLARKHSGTRGSERRADEEPSARRKDSSNVRRPGQSCERGSNVSPDRMRKSQPRQHRRSRSTPRHHRHSSADTHREPGKSLRTDRDGIIPREQTGPHTHKSRRRRRSRSPEHERRSKSREDYHRSKSPVVAIPTPRVRGRNANALGGSALNTHCLEDSKLDNGGTGEHMFDDQVEVFRARQKMKAQQVERLRGADWDEAKIEQWATSRLPSDLRKEGDLETVTWSKTGQEREWDRGKLGSSNEDGRSAIGFGRLKGT